MTILIFGLEEQKPKRGIILESRTNASKCLNLHVELSGFGGFHQHHQHCHCHMMIIFITITLVTAASTSVHPLQISNPCIIVIMNTVNHSR